MRDYVIYDMYTDDRMFRYEVWSISTRTECMKCAFSRERRKILP